MAQNHDHIITSQGFHQRFIKNFLHLRDAAVQGSTAPSSPLTISDLLFSLVSPVFIS